MPKYPKKETPNQYPINELIKKRWSPLAFDSKPIESDKIKSLFEAMRWAPSSYNEQPWRVIYATKDRPEDFEKMASLLMAGNSWARNAYMLLIVCSMPTFEHNGKNNRHNQYDAGAGAENLFLQAVSMDLIAHEMAGFYVEKAYDTLGIPKEINILSMIAVGYPSNSKSLPDDIKERQNQPRERSLQSEFVFRGKWANQKNL
ncbi:MAG: nitroreductase family protein [Candidatus Gracilibacteria bacterium]|jgi:nitroreductase